MKKLILRLIGALAPLWKRLGADPNHLEAILWVKLTMDDRRPRAVFARNQSQKRKKPINNATIATVITSLVMGFIYLYTFVVGEDYLVALTLFFFLFMVMLSVTLISDFTDVLMDVKDNYIILPKPVDARTILLARLLHILIHLSKIVLPMMLPGLVWICIDTGIAGGLLFCLDVAFATLLCICAINAVYLVILRFTTVERFKDIIGVIQIAFSILLFATYYIGPKLAANLKVARSALLNQPYYYPAPPLWLASLWEVLKHPAGETSLIYGLAVLGLVVPPLGLWAVIRFLGPSFDRKLSGLGAGSSSPAAPVAKETRSKRPLYRWLSSWLARGNAESAGFELSWLMTGRSRDFKLKVYPSFAYVLVYFFVWGLQGGKGASISDNWKHLPETKTYIILIYMSSLAMITAISNLVYSDKYKASWVYYVSPVPTPGEVLVGAVKAMLVKFFIPFYVGITVFSLYIWGPGILPHICLGLANVTWFGLLNGYTQLKNLPFSASMNIQAGTGRFMRALLILLIPTLVGFGHYFISRILPGYSWVIWVIFLLAAILVWMLYSKYRELGWAELQKAALD